MVQSELETVSVVERMISYAQARRELLWLRAKEREDEISADDLQHVDPALIERLRAAGADIDERPGEDLEARRVRFGELWDQCYRRHAIELWREGSSRRR